jgi:hypothetical protein
MLPQGVAQSGTMPHEAKVTSLILSFPLPWGFITYKKEVLDVALAGKGL